MKTQNYKFLKAAPVLGDWYKKGATISLNAKQARRFVDDKILKLETAAVSNENASSASKSNKDSKE